MSSTDLALITGEADLELATAPLDQLAISAADEHRAAEAQVVGALTHYIRLGCILLTVRDRLPRGEWTSWFESVGLSDDVVSQATRLAHYKAQIRGHSTVKAALRYLRGMGPPRNPSEPVYAPEIRSVAIRMSQSGASNSVISATLSVPPSTVRTWTNPAARKLEKARTRAKAIERKAAEKALAEKRERYERDRLANATGGELAEAYALVRRALTSLDRAHHAVSGPVRAFTDEASQHAIRAEAAIVNAMQESRREAP